MGVNDKNLTEFSESLDKCISPDFQKFNLIIQYLKEML